MRRGTESGSVRQFMLYDRFATSVVVLPHGEAYLAFAAETMLPYDDYSGPLRRIVDFDAGEVEPEPDPVLESTDVPQDFSVRALFLAGDSALWAVGDLGKVARYSLTPALGPGVVFPVDCRANLHAVWAHDNQLWAAGRAGTIIHFDGNEWRTVASGTSATIYALFGFAANDIWAAGENGTVLHYDGSTWSPIAIDGYQSTLRTIWGASPGDVWVGGDGAMFHWGANP